MSGSLTTSLSVGTRLVHDGELFTVAGVEAERLRLRGTRGDVLLVHTATLLSAGSTRILGVGDEPVEALGPRLDDLAEAQRAEMLQRLAHIRELLTGYTSGFASMPAAGEPRPEYHPSLPLKAKVAAKAAALGIDERTVYRWIAALRCEGAAGLIDGRRTREVDPLSGVDERWLQVCRRVLDEHTNASRPTKDLLLARVSARLVAEYGENVVPVPGRRRVARVLKELTRGTNALVGSTKGKRSAANRPKGVYGRLRPTRPGEYVLLDSTPLDVFAMEPLTLRWVGVELSVALDLYSRCILGLRLSPLSTKSVDAALMLYETLMPDTVRGTGGGLLPYAGIPDTLVVEDQSTGLPDGPTGAPAGLPGWRPRRWSSTTARSTCRNTCSGCAPGWACRWRRLDH